MLAAATLSRPGQAVDSLAHAHQAIALALGGAAGLVFALALYAAGQSSTLTGMLAGRQIRRGFARGGGASGPALWLSRGMGTACSLLLVLIDRGGRGIADVFTQGGDIGPGIRYVAGLHRQQSLFDHAAQALFHQLDKLQQGNGLVIADVVDTVGRLGTAGAGLHRVVVGVGPRSAVQGADDAFDDIVDIGEVATVVAVVEYVQRLAAADRSLWRFR